jgi:hypothetical protein
LTSASITSVGTRTPPTRNKTRSSELRLLTSRVAFRTSARQANSVPLSRNRPWRPIGLQGVEDPTLSGHRLTEGGKAISPTHRPRSTPQKHYFAVCGTHFCCRLSKPQGLVRPEGLDKLKTFIQLIGSLTLVICIVF